MPYADRGLAAYFRRSPYAKLAGILLVAAVMIGHYLLYPPDPAAESLRKAPSVPQLERPLADTADENADLAENGSAGAPTQATRSPKWIIPDIAIRDEDDQLVYQGSVELSSTVERIRAGRKLRFPNDGAVFQNRERRLPDRPRGYYREYVHPTDGLSGPGPQRIIKGRNGELYYTPDHYKSFRRWDE